MSPDDEALQTIKIAELIKCQSEGLDLDYFKGPGDGTEHGRIAIRDRRIKNILRSKRRLCQECYNRQKKTEEEWYELSMKEHEELSLVSERENERRNKPIKSCTSDLDRYIISLPDRSSMLEKEFGYDVFDRHWRDWSMECTLNMEAKLHALFSTQDPHVFNEAMGLCTSSEIVMNIREDIKTNFIKDSDRIFP
jgi:hypothetical protein